MVLQGTYKTYCIEHPQESGIRFVGIGRYGDDQPWTARWELREFDRSKLAAWFRQLEQEGVRPVEADLGLSIRGSRLDCRMVARNLIWVADQAGWPVLNTVRADGFQHRALIGSIDSAGRVTMFGSASEASRSLGYDRSWLHWLKATGWPDRHGRRYFEG